MRRVRKGMLFGVAISLILFNITTQSDYSFRVYLPTSGVEEQGLTLPQIPIYDGENSYLRVRNTSLDWVAPEADRKGSSLLNADVRILPALDPSAVELNEDMAEIPAQGF